jgi:hypothetical protein
MVLTTSLEDDLEISSHLLKKSDERGKESSWLG